MSRDVIIDQDYLNLKYGYVIFRGQINLCYVIKIYILRMMSNSGIQDVMLKAYIDKIFDKYDVDKSGTLDEDEMIVFFNDLFKQLGIQKTVNKQESLEAIKSIDKNFDGHIDKSQLFEAFKMMLFKAQQASQPQPMYNPNMPPPYGYPNYGYAPQYYPPPPQYGYPQSPFYQQPPLMYGSQGPMYSQSMYGSNGYNPNMMQSQGYTNPYNNPYNNPYANKNPKNPYGQF